MRAWEDSTYQTFDSLVKDLAERARRKPVVDTTDATGHAELRIPASRNDWWVTATSWDVTDPNMSWYWNMRLTGDTTALGFALRAAKAALLMAGRLSLGGWSLPALALLAACRGGAAPEPARDTGEVSAASFAAAPSRATAEPVRAVSDTDHVDSRSNRSLGSASAPVTVYEMSDFQCPFCRRHALETMPTLEREYVKTGKVRWIFINFPIPEIHPNAVPAAEFAMCAARSGRFWQAHGLLFRNQSAWARLPDPAPFLLSLADSARVPRRALLACLRGSGGAPRRRGRGAGIAPLRRQQHAELLHRGRAAGRRPAHRGVPPHPGLGHPGAHRTTLSAAASLLTSSASGTRRTARASTP